MPPQADQEQPIELRLQARIDALNEAIMEIRRKMEALAADNQRLRELARISENELRNRRDQARKLEAEIQAGQHQRAEAKARVEHVMEQMDKLLSVSNGL